MREDDLTVILLIKSFNGELIKKTGQLDRMKGCQKERKNRLQTGNLQLSVRKMTENASLLLK